MEAEKKRIQEAVARWEQSIAHGDGPPAFFRPDPSLLGQLEKIRGDEKAIAQALTQNFSLETVEVLVLLRNPDIRAAEDRMRAAIQGLRQVTALDEILMRYSAFTEGVMAGVGPMKGKEPVEMRFPFPGVLALKGQIAQQEVRIARDALEAARRDAMTEARKDFWRLMYNREALQITRETLDLFEHLEQVATARYETGKTSFQDVVKIRIERGILADRVTSFQEQTKNLEIRICAALNLPPSTRLGAPLGKHPSKKIPRPERLYDIALERNQELLQLRDRIGKMERMIEMAETMILPPFSMNLSLYEDEAVNQVGTQATKETFPVSIKASRGLGLPKRPFYGVEDAYLLQTRQEINALKEQLDARKQETITMVRNAWYGLDKAIRGEALYRDHILGSAKAALDVSSRGYESGKVVFADVISSYTLWLRSNLEKERWGAEIGIAWAELEKALGTTID
jgi:outer membrane protein TolC